MKYQWRNRIMGGKGEDCDKYWFDRCKNELGHGTRIIREKEANNYDPAAEDGEYTVEGYYKDGKLLAVRIFPSRGT